MSSHPTPPLLLTKRLTAFLHANQTPQLPTLLLTTPHGKLLAHASPSPVSLLRTHATVAASLLAIHTSSSTALPSALPGARTPDPIGSSPPDGDEDDDEEDDRSSRKERKVRTIKPVTITVQLSGGTVVIRRLKCGLLFVCVGPAAGETEHHDHHGEVSQVGSPSEVDSMISAGGQTTTSLESAGATAVVAMRRHAADLARWLDDKLGTLTVPEEGVGVE
ncbi:Fc.00g060300.m01.CDS01 [Cosmosporella sp. VM-42]